MSIALQLLQDDEAGDPHASPQSVIALCSRLDEVSSRTERIGQRVSGLLHPEQRLNGVKDHASQHNTDGMAEEIEHMTQTMQQQCRQAKGVAQFLTDDPRYSGVIALNRIRAHYCRVESVGGPVDVVFRSVLFNTKQHSRCNSERHRENRRRDAWRCQDGIQRPTRH